MLMTWLDWAMLAAAAWRLAYLLVYEEAPWRLAARLRARFPDSPLQCLYCTSVWAAALLWLVWHTPARPLVDVLAISGLALLLWRYTGGAHGD